MEMSLLHSEDGLSLKPILNKNIMEEVHIYQFDDGLWGIYNSSGHCIEGDFKTEVKARKFCIDNDLNIVDLVTQF